MLQCCQAIRTTKSVPCKIQIKMKKLSALLVIVLSVNVSAQQPVVTIVPMPANIDMPVPGGSMTITRNTHLVLAGTGLEKSAAFLNSYLLKTYGFKLPISKAKTAKNAITLNY